MNSDQKDQCYFIQCENFVKIGMTYNVDQRLKCLKTGNPFPLKVLLVTYEYNEGELHKRFNKYHHEGEWFRYEGNLKKFLEKKLLEIKSIQK